MDTLLLRTSKNARKFMSIYLYKLKNETVRVIESGAMGERDEIIKVKNIKAFEM